MVTVKEAKALIKENSKQLASEIRNTHEALGYVLSEKIVSSLDLPSFPQSAMDGYGFIYSDIKNKRTIKVVGEVPAGTLFKNKVVSGQAVKIYTGAPVPQGVDTIVMKEKVEVKNNHLLVKDDLLIKGANIRKQGSQIKRGTIALRAGTILNPGGIGFLATLGIPNIAVISKPRVSIIVTGNELQKPGNKLTQGQVYESNSFMLEAALQAIHIKPTSTSSVVDDEQLVFQSLKKAVKESDLVILTGGISVGDYDFVGKSLEKLGVETVFYKVKQKPGKPLFFGRLKNTLIFALPGNPAAALTCFYEYIYPAILIMQGYPKNSLDTITLPIACNYNKKKGLSNFLKGKIGPDNTALPLDGQESFILRSFSGADCLIYLPPEKEQIKKGQLVEVHILPQ